jgi:UDP-N-acetylglucosamine 1-carboxyvinyltransferase
MPRFIVRGGEKLKGEVMVGGSKNAALPILCAAMLTDEIVTLNNVPDIADIRSMIKILESFGAKCNFEGNTLIIDPSEKKIGVVPEEVVKKMRASILVIGALLPVFKTMKMPFPGGCVLGKRSIDSHIHVFKEFGAEILDEKEGIHIKCEKMVGKKIVLPELSVTATENAIMGAVLAEGESEIRLAATEPHVQDLCHFLNKLGAKVTGIGTNNVKIKGVKKLQGAKYRITGDYLEAGTFAIAAAATKGDVLIKGIDPDHLDSFWQKLREIGVELEFNKDSVRVVPRTKQLKSVKVLRTGIYPGFPTDLQAPLTVLLTQAKGVSKIFETLFEGRLNYLFELENMGAHIEFLNPHQAIVLGPSELQGKPISSYDIRAGAAMVIAALIAEGTTEISNVNYIDRGYSKLDEKLQLLGADIHRITS